MSAQLGEQDESIGDATPGVVHQVLQREVNERIVSVDREFGQGELETLLVICECSQLRCAARIAMTAAEYERLRRFPTRFVVKAGHELAEDERVVAESDDYVVVEANGRGGLYAVGADPRRRTLRSVEAPS